MLIGGPETGKSHIATALGVQAAEHHRKKVRFFAMVNLVNGLGAPPLGSVGRAIFVTLRPRTARISRGFVESICSRAYSRYLDPSAR